MNLGGQDTEFWVRLAVAILVLVAAWLLNRFMRRSIRRFAKRHELAEKDPGAETRFRMIGRLSSLVIYFIAFGLAFWLIDQETFNAVATAMFASAGIAGIAIGFAAQTVVANLVSGIIIAFVQPVRLGDDIDMDEEHGIVQSIGLFYTTIELWDNRHLLIPNKILSDRIIHNYTIRDPRMVAVVMLRVDYGSDLQAIRALLVDTARGHPLLLPEPEPVVQVVDADFSGLSVRLKAWVGTKSEASTLASDVREAVAGKLDQLGATVGVTSIRILPEGGDS